MDTVSFTQMADGTAEDYAFLAKHEAEFAYALPDRIMRALEGLRDSLAGYKIDRLTHSLQCATRAERDGADIDWVVSVLVHDLGDDLAPLNHDSFAAAILRPYVRDECAWVVQHHGIFQYPYYANKVGLDPDAHLKFKDHPYFDAAVKFCRDWDQASFDPDYDTYPLEHFRGMVETVFRRPAWDDAHIKA
ncbi:HD domain-containing protein [Litorimonas sp. RW-G-Af-16]|uniref:HD domain-containing protein n=1 Tax=Litorimonas sp. RW-G-Af-16 TaxID=3241168 RepID=UPI00390C494A